MEEFYVTLRFFSKEALGECWFLFMELQNLNDNSYKDVYIFDVEGTKNLTYQC